MSRVLDVIISHQSRADLERVLDWWSGFASPENLVIAYGGSEEEYARLPEVPRVFVDDASLRTRDQQRGKQSHGAVFRAVAQWLEHAPGRDFTHVYYAEFDHLPLVADLAKRLLDCATQQEADVLAHALQRVDGTSNVHYLYHVADPNFTAFWRRISVRSDADVVLKFVVTGSFWTREAFLAVARQKEEIAAYVELYVPTLAHHLGFRVRGFDEQDRCVSTMSFENFSIEQARAAGCWTMHPIKTLPTTPSAHRYDA